MSAGKIARCPEGEEMALSGIEIYKKLPKTNCKDCGVPTCMAFAMKLAAGQAELSACPHVDPAVAEELGAAAAPPIRTVAVGAGDAELKVGGETVAFRHEKTFVNKTGLGVLISEDMDDAAVDARIKSVNELQYERIGLVLKADVIAVKANDGGKLAALAKKVAEQTKAAIILMADSADAMKQGVEAVKDQKPLLYAATKDNVDDMAALAKECGCPLAVKGEGLDGVVELTEKLEKADVKDLVIDTGTRELKAAFEEQIQIRRLATKKTFKPLGFPTIIMASEMSDDPAKQALYASIFIAKYGGIIIMSEISGETIFPLLLERLNIYTDPQRPMAQKPGIYEMNDPDENSPVLVTSNFSLTYFIVSSEIEGGKIPAWLVVVDTEGLSVLTAWAAGKFAADLIGPYIIKQGLEDKVKQKKLVIPGVVAGISGELEEEMPGWEILIGPREAAHLVPFMKDLK
jgi:acetyl-CoA decarbonylase/synthase complex subunit gamma